MQTITLALLLEMHLPGHTVRLAEGGRLVFDGDSYAAKDDLVGVLAGVDALAEGIGDEAPALTLTFNPPAGVASADLLAPDWQGSRVRMWVAEIDRDTGAIDGDPEQEIDAMVDVPTLHHARAGRTLESECVASWQRLFDINEGNVLSSEFHQRIHPSEMGLQNATGVGKQFAWGAQSPRGTQ